MTPGHLAYFFCNRAESFVYFYKRALERRLSGRCLIGHLLRVGTIYLYAYLLCLKYHQKSHSNHCSVIAVIVQLVRCQIRIIRGGLK